MNKEELVEKQERAVSVLTMMAQDCGPIDAEPYSSLGKILAQDVFDMVESENADRDSVSAREKNAGESFTQHPSLFLR